MLSLLTPCARLTALRIALSVPRHSGEWSGTDSRWVDRLLRLQDDVASFLMESHVAVVFAEDFYQLRAAQIARQFHVQVRTSSRTK